MSQKNDRDSLLLKLNLTDQPSKKITILNILSKSYLEEDPNRSENFAQQALFISESIDSDQGKAESLFQLSQIALNKTSFDKSHEHILKALESFQVLEDEKWIAKSNLLLGEIYLAKYEYEKSLEVLYKAMNLFISLQKENKLAETYNLIGLNYYQQGNYNKAFEYLQNGLLIAESVKSINITSSLYNNMANIYLARKNYLTAKAYYNKAISINIKKQKNYCLAINYAHLGFTYLQLQKADSALYYLNSALTINQKEKNNYLLSLIKLNLGKVYMSIGDYHIASEELTESYNVAMKHSILNNITKASKELSDLYSLQKDYEKAYHFHRQYKLNEDSLSTIQNTEKITNLEMKLLFDQEQELRKLDHQKSSLKFFSLLMALLSLLILIIILYTRLIRRIKPSITESETLQLERNILRDKIDFKNRELTTNLMYLLRKNELINFISGKLQKTRENFKKENKAKVQEIITFLQSNVDHNLWHEFEERFQEVHKDFYIKLDNINPNLKENDKKLCTFIRLNLSTKEISGITHQNLNSIEVSRTRLRKKLNITNTDINLHSFLTNL